MAWDPLGENEYSGDLPMDAFGIAWTEIAALWQSQVGRLPTTAEATAAMRDALRRSHAMTSIDPAAIDAALDVYLTTPRAPKVPRRKHPVAGDLLRIPYGGGGTRAVYGRMLYTQPPTKEPAGSEYLPCCAVLDRDVLPDDDLLTVPDSPWMLGPMRVGFEVTSERIWEVVGHMPLRPQETDLPYFIVGRDGCWIIVDYFDNEVPDLPEAKARVRQSTSGFDQSPSIGSNEITQTIRAARGLRRWEVRFNRLLAQGRVAPDGRR